MRQVIARIDDELHARLRARAAAEGRSLNDLVTALLAAAVEQSTTRHIVRARARVAGQLVVPDRPQHIPTHEQTFAETRGLGQAASEALLAERATR